MTLLPGDSFYESKSNRRIPFWSLGDNSLCHYLSMFTVVAILQSNGHMMVYAIGTTHDGRFVIGQRARFALRTDIEDFGYLRYERAALAARCERVTW